MKIKICLFFCIAVIACKNNSPAYLNHELPVEKRVEDLLSRMTLEEKVAQLHTIITSDYKNAFDVKLGHGNVCNIFSDRNPKEAAQKYNQLQHYITDNSRLHIPVIYHGEAVFGLMANGMTTFPQPIAQAAAFNPQMHFKMADIISREAHSRGVVQVLSPDLNLANDVRWGRIHETYGEDPCLSSELAVAFIKAFQQNGVICTPKHFVANIGDGGRFGGDVSFGERLLREYYLVPFKAAVEVAHVQAIMPAYNSIDGIACHANDWLLNKVLRQEWNFDGFTSSDYGGVIGVLAAHRMAKDSMHAAAECINAGMDVEMPEIGLYGKPLLDALKAGLVKEETLNKAVGRVLRVKFNLGLFEHPYVDPNKAAMISNHPDHRKMALEYSRQSIVLMKNENKTLPFNKNIKSIAVLGPLANDIMLGNYAGWGIKMVSVLDGIKSHLPPTTNILFEKGVEFGDISLSTISENDLTLPDQSGKGLKAEYFNNLNLEGTPVYTKTVKNIDFDWGEWVPETVVHPDSFSARYTGYFVATSSGKYKIGLTLDDGGRIYLDDKLIVNDWRGGSVRISQTDFIFEKGRRYKIRIEYFDNLYKAILRLGWTGYPSANIAKAVDDAKKADAVVIVVGATDGEGRDRATLELTDAQQELIKAVAATKKPIVVVLATGNVITMSKWIDLVPALVEQWYPGEEGGNALAEVLFGEYNPGGKLPVTFPQVTGQVPLRYNQKPEGALSRYIVYGNEPQFAFGHGLSYTTFEIGNLKLAFDKIKKGESLSFSVDVKNTGDVQGDEVIQIYVHRKFASVALPEKELKEFKRVSLKPGESKTITFTIAPDRLSLWNKQMKFAMEPGDLTLMVGNSSKNITCSKDFKIIE